MNRFPTTLAVKAAALLFGILSLSLLTGCIGIYSNADLFTLAPHEGQTEVEVIQTYGTPAFATNTETQKVYTYKVRNNMYIILFGLYDGRDIVILCEQGKVTKVNQVQRPKTFCLFQPWTWSDTE